MELWWLFASAFISSTLFPGGSEVVLGYLAHQQHTASLTLLFVATLGNTLGGMTSWALGLVVPRLDNKHNATIDYLHRYGAPVLLFSWVPILGDPLCLVAGWLRLAFWKSLFFIAVGKLLRYIAVIYFVTP